MKGYKDGNGKFHPLRSHVRLKRQKKIQGVKIIRKARKNNSSIKNITRQDIIDVNEKVLQDPYIVQTDVQEPFFVRQEINEVIQIVADAGNTEDKKQNIIEKASYLLASISWVQPFLGGNKRTAIISTSKFLEDNGFDFEIINKDDKKELQGLLFEIQENRSELDNNVIRKIIFYTRKHIKKHE